MSKRVISIFLAFTLTLGALTYRIASISIDKPYLQVAGGGKTKTITVASSRGMIYDRNMEKLVNERLKYYSVLKPDIDALALLGGKISEEKYYEAFLQISEEKPILVELDKPLVDTNSMKVLEIYERYSDKQTAAHIIGYLDSSKSEGVSGLEKSFDTFLAEHSGSLAASFTINGLGKVLDGEEITVKNKNYNSIAGLSLTLDKEIQNITETALEHSDITKGTAVVLDVKTSAVLAIASAPVFSPNNLAASLNDENSPFINRALTAYSVGSVYKPIVAAAAVEKGIDPDYTYNCKGNIKIENVTFNCFKRDGHGAVNMDKAISVSCNCYFIHLASLIGKESIISMSNRLGLGAGNELAEGLAGAAGIMPQENDIINPGDLANLSFGQGKLLSTPLQIAAAYACFANGGVYNKPYLLNKMIDENGETLAEYIPDKGERVMSKHISEIINRALTLTVEDGSGKNAKPANSTAAGKTATAQSGWFKDGKEIVQTWFAGYFPADKPEYVIVIMKEDGSSPTTDCAPVFKEIAEKIPGS